MRYIFLLYIFVVHACFLSAQRPNLSTWQIKNEKLIDGDWLVKPVSAKAAIYLTPNKKDIVLYNGLLKRTFRIKPNVVCTGYKNMINGQQLLRSVKPEAKLVIDGYPYDVGGLTGQQENAYLLPEWVDDLKNPDSSFQFISYEVSDIKPFLDWKTNMWTDNKKQATGKMIAFKYLSLLPILKGIEVTVNYEIYDGLPLICKSVLVKNNGTTSVKIDREINEILGMVEEESAVVGSPQQMKKPSGMYVETNYAFNNAMRYEISDQTLHWNTDSAYTSQVNYNFETPCLLEVYTPKAPGIQLQPGEVFKSIRTYELLLDSYDRERRGLAIRKMYRTIAPWTTSNPIFMHLVSKNDEEVRNAIDQCVATGYEAVILSFGSHLNMEDTASANIKKWKELTDYAHHKNIFIGGYSLFSSRKISDEDDVIDPATGKPGGAFFGNAPCFGSKWGLAYRDKIKYFFSNTGFDIWENDGPYPGDVCASTSHPGHTGLDDSQWRQMEIQKELYHWLNERGVYINAPDWYFLDGTNKTGIGYREVNFSLPREDQMILNRQNIFDGTWDKTPSMGWGFVPLTRYQGGGPEAVLEPLSEHLQDYKQLMMQYYGSGVQACYRGPRLYDTDATKQEVIETITWYKKYRDILNSDIIHLRRADGRDWDGILHVNPMLKNKGLLILYNPLKQKITRTIKVPLYYTGLTSSASVSEKGSSPKMFSLNRNYEIELTFSIEPKSYMWILIQ
ncbi:MAG: alpha-galactosidase [Ginsengibacter sp.]